MYTQSFQTTDITVIKRNVHVHNTVCKNWSSIKKLYFSLISFSKEEKNTHTIIKNIIPTIAKNISSVHVHYMYYNVRVYRVYACTIHVHVKMCINVIMTCTTIHKCM